MHRIFHRKADHLRPDPFRATACASTLAIVRDEWAVALKGALAASLPRGWRESAPWGYPDQSELAVIAGVFSAQVPLPAAQSVASAFMVARPGRMLDDLADLASMPVEDLTGCLGDEWGATTVLGVARLRAAVIGDVARGLAEAGIRSGAEYREAVRETPAAVDRLLQDVRGVGVVTSGAISTMLQAEPPPSARVAAHVRELLGEDGDAVDPDDLSPLIRATARRLTVEPRVLLHALWREVDAPAGDSSSSTPVDERDGSISLA